MGIRGCPLSSVLLVVPVRVQALPQLLPPLLPQIRHWHQAHNLEVVGSNPSGPTIVTLPGNKGFQLMLLA